MLKRLAFLMKQMLHMPPIVINTDRPDKITLKKNLIIQKMLKNAFKTFVAVILSQYSKLLVLYKLKINKSSRLRLGDLGGQRIGASLSIQCS